MGERFSLRSKASTFFAAGKINSPKKKPPSRLTDAMAQPTDLKIIRASSWTRALIGVHTGKSGLVVLDIDRKDGKDGFADAPKTLPDRGFGELVTSTFCITTPSGGAHFVFRDPGGKIGRIIDAFKALNGGPSGVDILGGDGYFIFHSDDVPPNFIDLM